MRGISYVVLLLLVAYGAQAAPLPGGVKQAAISAEAVKVAQWAVSQLNTRPGVNGKPLAFDSVLSARSQVVAGTKWYLTVLVQTLGGGALAAAYNVTVWSKPAGYGGNKRQPNYELLAFAKVASGLQPSSANMAGGVTAGPVNLAGAAAARWAVSQLNTKDDVEGKPLKFVKVLSMRTQVVAGLNYYLTVQVADADNQLQTYELTVWEKPIGYQGNRLPSYELSSYKRM